MSGFRVQPASFGLGALCAFCAFLLLGAGGESFSPEEVVRLKTLASYVQPDGNLNLGNRKILMLGSSIYDDGSEGGGLILRGGAHRVQIHGDAVFRDNLNFTRDTVDIGADLNLGKKKIIMQGSSIYDDGSEGGGLILQGGANRVQVRGDAVLYEGVAFRRDTIDVGANLNLGRKKIVMQGSSIYDDGSEGGGLILRGGANRVHFFGQTQAH